MIPTKDIRTDLDSDIWGKHGWFFIDSIVLSYPQNPTPNEKLHYQYLFYSFPIVLPCAKCRTHFNQYLTSNPLDDAILSSKKKLIIWILNAHNNVNKINNKKIITLDEFYLYYNTKYNINVIKDTCKTTCGLKQPNIIQQKPNSNSNSNSNSNPNSNPNSNSKLNPNLNYKYISIILFGFVIALGLCIFRQNQLSNIK
jgi:hypothetical protein